MTKNEALQYLVRESAFEFEEMGDNSLVCGDAYKFYKVCLQTSYEAGTFDVLVVQLYVNSDLKQTEKLRLDSVKYRQPREQWNNPHYTGKGGYFWTGSNQDFYMWKPQTFELAKDLDRILNFWEG